MVGFLGRKGEGEGSRKLVGAWDSFYGIGCVIRFGDVLCFLRNCPTSVPCS